MNSQAGQFSIKSGHSPVSSFGPGHFSPLAVGGGLSQILVRSRTLFCKSPQVAWHALHCGQADHWPSVSVKEVVKRNILDEIEFALLVSSSAPSGQSTSAEVGTLFGLLHSLFLSWVFGENWGPQALVVQVDHSDHSLHDPITET